MTSNSAYPGALDNLVEGPFGSDRDDPSLADVLNKIQAALGITGSFNFTTPAQAAALAPLANPALTGNPTAPTQAALTNNTRLATTAYADAADALHAPLASPALTGTPTSTTSAGGSAVAQIATVFNARPVVNILDARFAGGADPTGATDSSPAIQAAINALPATGGIVYCPGGAGTSYSLHSTLTIGNGVDGPTIQAGVAITSIASVTGSGPWTVVCNVVAPGVLVGSFVVITGGSGTGWTAFPGAYAVSANSGTTVSLTIPAGGAFTPGSAGAYSASSSTMTGGTTKSTRWGVHLVGDGGQNLGEGVDIDGGTQFIYVGSGGGTIVKVNGPLSDWGIEGISLEGFGALASFGLDVKSGNSGYCRGLTVVNCISMGIRLGSYHSVPGQLSGNSWKNNFFDTHISVVGQASGFTGGVEFTGTTDGQANSCYNTFITTTIVITVNGTGQCYGVYFAYSDNNHLISTEIVWSGSPTTGTNIPIVYDYTVNGAAPADNICDGFDFATSAIAACSNSGSPTNGGVAFNRISNVAQVNGIPSAPGIANVQWGLYEWGTTVPASFAALQTLLQANP